MLLTDVPGVKKNKDSDEIIPALTSAEALELINKKIIDGGMIPKVLGCIEALEKGVAELTLSTAEFLTVCF